MIRSERNRRILVVDDTEAIHADFDKLLGGREQDAAAQAAEDELAALERELFGEPAATATLTADAFELDHAYQGDEALEKVLDARAAGRPYALVFCDVRMPPGPDGIETTLQILQGDPQVAVVVCSAYSDHDWETASRAFGQTDRVLILKKPFDAIEVRQLARALVERWSLVREAALNASELKRRAAERTRELERANAKLRAEATERERMEQELRLAQKLEAVGQLAAGVAHEINTPMQYVGDSVAFLEEAFQDLLSVLPPLQAACEALARTEEGAELAAKAREAQEEADLEYLQEHVPAAIERTREGVERVTTIVRALKDFSHPDQSDMTEADLNHALQSTLIVARNEYKYVAEVETDFGELPRVRCLLGSLNQVFLNLIVNAAHAIEEKVEGTGERGTIRIATRCEDDWVEVRIADTGAGIPSEVRERVFDPFFTTKPVGRGTGQGLAIARRIVTETHGGQLDFTSEVGQGTEFVIRLPARGPVAESEKEAV
ncbi:MAG: hybrid sensor histidine kinase/response regulator [Planctomycetota bacterium]|nr:MAG: hybrid sensor histidine kinase/response regulator [Planctomycetota bacterium]